MATDEWIKDVPQLTTADYKVRYQKPCEALEEGFQWWYKGTGIAPAAHPLQQIPFRGCAACQSNNVLVIAAQHSVHPMNGDEYWDYEVECLTCGKFTQRAYAEN